MPPAPTPIRVRKALLATLLAAFATQGCLVYTDGKAAAQPPLDEFQMEGRAVYLSNNCGACHQLFGFGGFLGPDLTNATQRVSRARFGELLTDGSRQMPAYHLPPEDVDAVVAYLRAIDRTGQGVARSVVPPPVAAALAAVADAAAATPPDGPVARGHRVFVRVCTACHLPLRANPLGTALAPDPTGIAGRLAPADMDAVIARGRVSRGMPPPAVDAQERASVVTFLGWLHEQRPALVARCGEGQETSLPWWEYR